MDSTWEKRLVKRYYDKLFKEYPVLVNFLLHCSFYDDMSVHDICFRKFCEVKGSFMLKLILHEVF